MGGRTAPTPRLAALRQRDYRLLWSGQLVSTIGTQMQLIAVNWNVYELLKGTSFQLDLFGHHVALNSAALGLGTIGLARVIPIVLFALLGGVLADIHDRRLVVLWTQVLAALLAAALAAAALSGHSSLALLYVITSLTAAVGAFEQPAEQALVPQIVPRAYLTNAISLNQINWQVGTIVGPALAGVLISQLAIGVVYAINAASYGVVVAAVLLMSYRGAARGERTELSWDSLVEGLRFTYRTRLIWSTMLLDFFATFFSSARTMLPLVAGQVLGVGATGYGVLATAQSVGSVVTGIALSLRRDIYHQGPVLLVSVAVYGLATVLFGASDVFALSYVAFALTGAADTVSTVIRGTIRQLVTPDHLRGRMTSVNMVFFMGGPQLGELEAGLVASGWGAPIAIITGGLATLALTGLIAWRYPSLRHYTSGTSHEPSEKSTEPSQV